MYLGLLSIVPISRGLHGIGLLTLIPGGTLFRVADISVTAQQALERINYKRIRAETQLRKETQQ
jgi:hypothetical protein